MNKEQETAGMHIEVLRPEKIMVVNPLMPIIETLMSTVLSGHNWKQYTVDGVWTLVRTMMKEKGIPASERHYLMLKRKMAKCTSMEACLTILGEMLF
jgi:hypothetical protein